MLDYEAFLAGMKPALYGNSKSLTFMENFHLFAPYPCVTRNIDIFDGADFFLFFQDDELKENFLFNMRRVSPRSPEFHELLGVTLGYPPLAAKYYAQCIRLEQEGRNQEREKLDQFRVSIHYAGIRCTGHINDLTENAIWLWNRYEDNEDLKIGIGTKFYPVPRDNLKELDRLIDLKLHQIKEPLST